MPRGSINERLRSSEAASARSEENEAVNEGREATDTARLEDLSPKEDDRVSHLLS